MTSLLLGGAAGAEFRDLLVDSKRERLREARPDSHRSQVTRDHSDATLRAAVRGSDRWRELKPLEACSSVVERGFVVTGPDLLIGLRRQIDTPDLGRKWASTLLMSDILDFSKLAAAEDELAQALWDLAGGDVAASRERIARFLSAG